MFSCNDYITASTGTANADADTDYGNGNGGLISSNSSNCCLETSSLAAASRASTKNSSCSSRRSRTSRSSRSSKGSRCSRSSRASKSSHSLKSSSTFKWSNTTESFDVSSISLLSMEISELDGKELKYWEDNLLLGELLSEEDLLASIDDVSMREIEDAIDQVLGRDGDAIDDAIEQVLREDTNGGGNEIGDEINLAIDQVMRRNSHGLGRVSEVDNEEEDEEEPYEDDEDMNQGGSQVNCDVMMNQEVKRWTSSNDQSYSPKDYAMESPSPAPQEIIKPSSIFQACLSKSITLTSITRILDAFPVAAHILTEEYCPKKETSSYPLHLACYNEYCPSSVIELLVKKNAMALGHLSMIKSRAVREEEDFLMDMLQDPSACSLLDDENKEDEDEKDNIDFVQGLPLHHYMRRSSNLELDTIKVLVESHPLALSFPGDEARFTPLHTLLANPHVVGELFYAITQYMINIDPFSLRMVDKNGQLPLHVACLNKNMDSKIVSLLLEAWPESISRVDDVASLPIHSLCYAYQGDNQVISQVLNKKDEDDESLKILSILIDKSPSSVRHFDNGGDLPIHIAADNKSPEFCKMLVKAYPQSTKLRSDEGGVLPIHQACSHGRVDTAECLLELCPETLCMSTGSGFLPIHEAAYRLEGPRAEMIKLLLHKDPLGAVRMSATSRHLPLHLACESDNLDLESVQLLFDAWPEAIAIDGGDGRNPLEIARSQSVQTPHVIRFLEAQLRHSRQSRDVGYMTTRDAQGRLPLHRELRKNACLGTIKLLVKGNPAALHIQDYQGSSPVQMACEFCTSVEVVRFLVELDGSHSFLDHRDVANNSPLHYACRGGNCDTVNYLLDRGCDGGLAAVSSRNDDDKLPFHLLCESLGRKNESTMYDDECGEQSTEYTQVIWKLLLAFPEAVMQ